MALNVCELLQRSLPVVVRDEDGRSQSDVVHGIVMERLRSVAGVEPGGLAGARKLYRVKLKEGGEEALVLVRVLVGHEFFWTNLSGVSAEKLGNLGRSERCAVILLAVVLLPNLSQLRLWQVPVSELLDARRRAQLPTESESLVFEADASLGVWRPRYEGGVTLDIRLQSIEIGLGVGDQSEASAVQSAVARHAQKAALRKGRDEEQDEGLIMDEPSRDEVTSSARRYWAGGHQFGPTSMADEFVRTKTWRIGWPREAETKGAKAAWEQIERVQVGDWFAVKGYGGKNDLKVYAVGCVESVDREKGSLTWSPLGAPLYHAKAPGPPGRGTWFGTLCEVTNSKALHALFGIPPPKEVQPDPPPDPPPVPQPDLPRNLILHGPPGTGKTWRMRHLRSTFGPESLGSQFFVTFHPSFTYEDFVEGIRPESDPEGAAVRYPLRPGIFREACERAVQLAGFNQGLADFCALPSEERRAMIEDAPPTVLFIDEINRGNVARILGELITLLEPDKRLGAPEELMVTLPGSRTLFGVPSNLWLIGTMNTADRSVVALDVALRRRFAFEECPPDSTVLDGLTVEEIDLGRLLRTINGRLLVLRDRDHLLGHAFFLPLKDDSTLDGLRRVFANAVLPLLMEYFYDDLGRVGLVLGPAFVSRAPGGDVFAKGFEHEQRDDLAERVPWVIADVGTLGVEAFRAILDA